MHYYSIAAAAADLRAKKITSVELTEMALGRIRQLDDTLGAFIVVNTDLALAMARRADEDFAAGIDHGPLQGIPLSLKDNIATEDAPTTANSRVLGSNSEGYDGYDAAVTERLRAAGAVLVGKNVLMEFATGKSDPESFPDPLNPWGLSYSPGGSSSGTGIAIATGMVLGGLGTDTGGSIRHPSAKNGITGLKPTYGRVPNWGSVPVSYSQDSIGPMSRSAFDCGLILNSIAGSDPRENATADAPVDDYTDGIDAGVKGLRVGVPTEYFYDHPELELEVKNAALGVVEVLRNLGAEVVEINLPMAELSHIIYWITTAGDKAAYHSPDLAGKWQQYGQVTRRKIALGTLYSAADYIQAQRVRSLFCRDAAKVMERVDILVTPVTFSNSMLKAEEGSPLGANGTSAFNVLGYPALVLPSGFASNGMPLSSQIVGAPFAEATVLRAGHAVQQATDWHIKIPPIVQEVSDRSVGGRGTATAEERV